MAFNTVNEHIQKSDRNRGRQERHYEKQTQNVNLTVNVTLEKNTVTPLFSSASQEFKKTVLGIILLH